MKPHAQKSIWLFVILVMLLGIDWASQWVEIGYSDTLPDSPTVPFKELRKLRIVQKSETAEFELRDDKWHITSPFSAPADRAALENIRQRLNRGIKLELQVEENSDDLASFGLEPGVLLEAYTQEEQPAVAFYIGRNTSGGASFIRFPDQATVYRAHVGGVQNYGRPAAVWRDPVISEFDPAAVTAFTLTSSNSDLEFTRKDATSPWSLKQDANFPVDQEEVQRLITTLSGLRAGVVLSPNHPAGMEKPVALVKIQRVNADPIELTFARTLNGAFAKNSSKKEIYQIAPSFTERLAHPKQAWYNRLLLNIERTQIHRMSLTEKNAGTTILEQDPATNRWTVIKPANVDANLRECMQAAITLSSLRAFAMSALPPENAGFPSPNYIEVELLSGHKQRIELGLQVPGMPKGKEALFVRTSDTPDRIAVLPLRTIFGIRTAFSR